ncbi:MAG: low molecular weight protein arginine phosphatase [Defluviitaleaceae bacterium]|nr:low molecular weight protein arginine phosphatase [Defluviitaleaceae bacterium]
MSSILFVCTGNTCRSPMAATLAAAMFASESLKITVTSAGVSAFGGSPASKNAVLAMEALSLSLSAHKAQPAERDLIENSALILTMTKAHLMHIKAACPTANAYTLGEYAGSKTDISDPYGGSLDVYKACAAQIKTLLEGCKDKFKEAL